MDTEIDFSYYTGVTAYVKQNEENKTRLRVLSAAIPALGREGYSPRNIPAQFKDIMDTPAFTELTEFGGLFAPNESSLPLETPRSHQFVSVSHAIYNEKVPLTYLHFPCADTSKQTVDFVTRDALLSVLKQLFGSDLVCVKARAIDESGWFANAREDVLVSANAPVPA